MTELSTAEQNYLALKSDLQAAREDEANKRREIVALEQRRHNLTSELAALNQRLDKSTRAMSDGDMTTDDYLALKRSIADKALETEAVGEALEAQKDALQLLIDNSRNLGERLNRLLPAVAGEIKQRALVAGVAADPDQLKLFVIAAVAEHLRNHPWSIQDKTHQANLGYQILGEELCKAVFAETSESYLFLTEPSRAISAIEEIIGQAA